MSNEPPQAPPEEFHDRYVILVLFGFAEIGLAALLALFAALTVFMASMVSGMGMPQGSPPMDMNNMMMLGGAVMYGGMALFFGIMGLGSVMARRWARDLMVAVSWVWLVMGVLSLLNWIFQAGLMDDYMNVMNDSGQAAPPMPPGMAGMVTVFASVFIAMFGIVLPLALLLFYRSKHVKATCEWRDQKPRWTEKHPTPVLAMLMLLAVAAVGSCMFAFYGPIFPLFGIALEGPAALAMILVQVLLFGTLAYFAQRRLPWAWWGALILPPLAALSWLLSMGPITESMYGSMGMAPDVAQRMQGLVMQSGTTWMSYIGLLVWIAFVIYLKRYFRGQPGSAREDGPIEA